MIENLLENYLIYIWALIGIVLIIQASWIFRDASKRGEAKWLWAFFGLLNTPSNLIIYLIVTRLIVKSRPCSQCSRYTRESFDYCPHCGQGMDEKSLL